MKIPVNKIISNQGQIEGLPKNPRVLRDEQFDRLKKSIQANPDMLELRELLVVPHDDKWVVIAGNMRLRAMQDLGIKEAPCKVIPPDVPPSKLRAFTILDNAQFGEWDWDDLANEWDAGELDSWGIELPAKYNESQAVEDDYDPPEEIETDIKLGDMIEIGPHKLFCGSFQDSPFTGFDMVFTDPPYGVAIGKKNQLLNKMNGGNSNTREIAFDAESPEKLKEILIPIFKAIKDRMSDDCTVFMTAPQGGELGMMMMMMKEAGLPVRHMLIWKKNSPTFSMGRLDYDYQHEPILLTWNKKHKYYGKGPHRTSVWEIDKPRSSKEHPTMKPVALVENALLNNSTDGDTVLDAFMGSGTTMVAAHQLKRFAVGCEIEPHYCEVIIDRMLKLDPSLEIKLNGKPYNKLEQEK